MSPMPLLEPKSIRDTSWTPSASKMQPREPSFRGSPLLEAAAAYARGTSLEMLKMKRASEELPSITSEGKTMPAPAFFMRALKRRQ